MIYLCVRVDLLLLLLLFYFREGERRQFNILCRVWSRVTAIPAFFSFPSCCSVYLIIIIMILMILMIIDNVQRF